MESRPEQLPTANRVPTWALVVGPIFAAILSNADVLLLRFTLPRPERSEVTLALAVTLPLSVGACGLTLWFLLRLRREVDSRAVALTDLSEALTREQLLRRELDHRVRNNLSALLALVGMYEDSRAAGPDIVRALRGKILALRESYCLIATTHGQGIELADLLHAVVVALLSRDDARAVKIEGPSVRLTSREANAFAMIVQELLTNACKHGALHNAGGTIRVTWESAVTADQARVSLHWAEHPVIDAAAAPADGLSGMGLSLINGFATCDLRGSVSCQRTADRWNVDLVANVTLPSSDVETRTLNGAS